MISQTAKYNQTTSIYFFLTVNEATNTVGTRIKYRTLILKFHEIGFWAAMWRKRGPGYLTWSPHLVIRSVPGCQYVQGDLGCQRKARLEIQEGRECQEGRQFHVLPSVRERRNVHHHLFTFADITGPT